MAAVFLLQEGMEEEGLRVIRALRARYDGARRSPFDEAECGHHYARAMARWAAVLALTGFRWSAATGNDAPVPSYRTPGGPRSTPGTASRMAWASRVESPADLRSAAPHPRR